MIEPMPWTSACGRATIYTGDCLDVMRSMPDGSVDAVVCDPPYGLEFMGKDWDRLDGEAWRTGGAFTKPGIGDRTTAWPSYGSGDTANATCATCGGRMRGAKRCECAAPEWRVKGKPIGESKADTRQSQGVKMQEWHRLWAVEALRVAKPGAHLLAFGGTRTFHRLACAIEDAGWEIRDCLMWIYAQGFPKSARVNLDPKFCQCGETARSGECIDLARTTDDRTGTDRPSSDDGLLSEGGPRSTRTAPDSRGGCRLACDSDDAQPLLFGEAVRVSPPSREGAQERSRSAAPSDGPANAQERTPSPARRSDLHASTDSPPRVALSDEPPDTQDGRTLRADMSGTGDRKRGTQDDSSCADYAPGFPRCQVCGKPNADGWGTALKPAYEPVILARKPLAGTVAANVEKHGTGALNIDGCRIATTDSYSYPNGPGGNVAPTGLGMRKDGTSSLRRECPVESNPLGRWPANVLLDEDAAAALDEQSGAVGGAGGDTSGPNALGQSSGWNAHTNRATEIDRIKDSGGASRFFYTAKASRSEREAGLREAGLREAGRPHEYRNIQDGRSSSGADYARPSVRNVHPTVKPVDLMRWLVRLVTPLGGVVLDPFLGSGTTLVAALQEGCKAIGIEREAPYVEIAKARVAHEAAQGRLFA